MSYVTGEKGEYIQKLMDESNKAFDNNNFKESIQLLEKAWEELPDEKIEWAESYLIVWGILDIAILINDKDIMEKWVDKIFICSPQRVDSGERELWAGKVAYEIGDFVKAKEYFSIADTKSRGRCFGSKDRKYIKLLKE